MNPSEIGKQLLPSREQLASEGAELPVLDEDGKDINAPFYGRKHKNKKGTPHTEEHKKYMSELQTGRPHPWSDEAKARFQETMVGENNPNYIHGRSRTKEYNNEKGKRHRDKMKAEGRPCHLTRKK